MFEMLSSQIADCHLLLQHVAGRLAQCETVGGKDAGQLSLELATFQNRVRKLLEKDKLWLGPHKKPAPIPQPSQN
ncbi:MAG TPA: hypothetical protein VFA18_05060 [Gemmataceae bacterium]|nr:hypothetical protein [Gemmataceae bacterium]